MKYQRLLTLQKNHILTPKSFLYKGDTSALGGQLTKPSIIVRSSYRFEDGNEQSYAGFFQSIGPISIDDIHSIKNAIQTIRKDAKEKLTAENKSNDGFDVFIQEYQEIDSGGVIFIQDDKLLLQYSKGGNGTKNIVNGIAPDATLYLQQSFELSNGDEIGRQYKKAIFKTIKKIQKIFPGDLDIEFGCFQGKVYIFQVRPLTVPIFTTHAILDSSNIGENFPGTVSKLTASFVTHLYTQVYQSLAHNSGISLYTIAQCHHIFQDLIAYKDGKLFYNSINWYKMLLLFPGDHKKSFDTMIGSSGKVDYIVLDDMIDLLPGFCFHVKYYCLLIWKIVVFPRKLKRLTHYLENFYEQFESLKLEHMSLSEVYVFYKQFESRLNAQWYLTIENDFVIMKMGKNLDLTTINGLISAHQIESLIDVANGRINIEEYKKIYGARLGDELKLENTQADNDRVLKEIIAQYQKYDENKRAPMKETTKIPSFLHRFIKNREQFRLYRAKNFHIARLLFLSIGDKLTELGSMKNRNDIFDMNLQEITNLVYAHQRILQKTNEKILIGKPFSGRIYVMKSFNLEALQYDIIVAENFDPGWTSLLGNLKGIVIEHGNLLSHVSIMCRELNIPLLIGAKESMLDLCTGEYISVNTQGDVTKL